MKFFKTFSILCVFFIFLTIIPFTNLIFADTHNPCDVKTELITRDTKKPEKYTVDVSILNVGEFDRKTGSYDLDFRVFIRPQSAGLDLEKFPPPPLEFINGKNIQISHKYCNWDLYEYRVKGTFFSNIDYRYYPFETLTLKILIESASPATKSLIEFVTLDNHGFAVFDSEAHLSGFEQWNEQPEYEIIFHNYSSKIDVSRIVITHDMNSIASQSILKIMLPILILSIVVLLSYFLESKKLFEKLTLTIFALFTMLAFDATIITNELPPLDYLTFADKLISLFYILSIYSIIISILEYRRSSKFFIPPSPKKLKKKIWLGLLIVIIISSILLIFFEYIVQLLSSSF